MQTKARTLATLTAALLATGLAGCGESGKAAAPSAAATLTIKDPWVKAADADMTAAFGTLVNQTGRDLTVVSATSPASPIELHEVAMQDGKMVMRPKEGGLVVKAGGTHELSPGGDHLMLLKPSGPIKPGDQVRFTLTLADGSTVPFTAVAKPFAGGGESYAPSASPMGGM
jgi:periplasmic copper chaperone A